MSKSNKDCWKKVIGNRPPSSATPDELKRIEKCTVLAAGGNYTGPLKEKRGYKQPDTLKNRGGGEKRIMDKKMIDSLRSRKNGR